MPSSPASSTHKPRRRNKDEYDVPVGLSAAAPTKSSQQQQQQQPPFPLASFFWPARGGLSKWALLPILFLVAGLFRWACSLWPYSGLASPPMHGDFEAQRHWMEITIHLPISHWYFHDLQWWGLDYPPLTAYHSWALGKIGSFINPGWFELYESRGLDDAGLKTFMRGTVLVSEYLVFVPALVSFVRRLSFLQRVSSWEASLALMAILMQPGLILIDHAHFQYNTVMLGFVVACLASVLAHKYLWACVFFVAALGFKQMTLYYAPAVFAFLLGSCFTPRINPGRLFAIAAATAVMFVALFAPLVIGSLVDKYRGLEYREAQSSALGDILGLPKNSAMAYVALQLSQSIHRIFPFARGLFEDKVANFWCSLHTFYKLRHFRPEMLQRLSLAATAASILPPCLAIGIFPDRTLLPVAFATTAWGFFLFSFQVHEKSVLLPLLPMTLLLAGDRGMEPETRAWISWANILGSWTMFPLLKRDELRVPYFVLTLLWGWLMGEPSILSLWAARGRGGPSTWTALLHGAFYAAMIGWHIGEALVPPPAGKPDLWVVINVLVGTAGFGICYLWCLARLLQALPSWRSWSAGGKSSTKAKKAQ